MTLYEYIEQNPAVDEFTVWDTDYDIETYFYHEDDPDDEWGQAMKLIAQKLEVKEYHDEDKVCVDLSALVERNLNNGVFERLFIRNNTDDIMDDIENIFSGCVSEKWLSEFAVSLT